MCQKYVQRMEKRLSQYHIFSKSFSINKSNLLAGLLFHQSATGDIRENLDFAVERQNCA